MMMMMMMMMIYIPIVYLHALGEAGTSVSGDEGRG